MKESDQSKESPLTWDFDQSFSSFLQPAARLCLNTLDFSDLWDEEDSTEDEGTSEPPRCLQAPPAPPPLPPPPPLALTPKKGESIKCRTLKLHWRELQSLAPLPRMTRFGTQTIWAGLEPVHLDTNRLEYLFESKGGCTNFNLVSGRQVSLMKQGNVTKMVDDWIAWKEKKIYLWGKRRNLESIIHCSILFQILSARLCIVYWNYNLERKSHDLDDKGTFFSCADKLNSWVHVILISTKVSHFSHRQYMLLSLTITLETMLSCTQLLSCTLKLSCTYKV